jgi:hypothetical protein
MKKGTSIRISEDQVPDRFNAEFIDHWVRELKIPSTQKSNFSVVCREVACLYVQKYSSLDQRKLAGQVRREIQDLSNAAEDQKYDDVSTLRENLSKRACDLLSLRGPVPSADELRGPNREAACATVAKLCRTGGRGDGRIVTKSECEIDSGHLVVMAAYKLALAEEEVILKKKSKDMIELRAAQSAHRTALEVYNAMLRRLRDGSPPVPAIKIERKLVVELWAPRSPRNFPKRSAERHLVARLHAAVSEARGRLGKWANPSNPSPFVRFVQEFLNRVGYPDQNAAQIINGLAKKEAAGDAARARALNAEWPEPADIEQVAEQLRSLRHRRQPRRSR